MSNPKINDYVTVDSTNIVTAINEFFNILVNPKIRNIIDLNTATNDSTMIFVVYEKLYYDKFIVQNLKHIPTSSYIAIFVIDDGIVYDFISSLMQQLKQSNSTNWVAPARFERSINISSVNNYDKQN